MTDIQKRIEKHAQAAEAAYAKGDIVTYCQERKALLQAQYEFWVKARAEKEAK